MKYLYYIESPMPVTMYTEKSLITDNKSELIKYISFLEYYNIKYKVNGNYEKEDPDED